MSSFTVQQKTDGVPLDGSSDLKPEVKTSHMINLETVVKEKKVQPKKTKS